MEAIIKGNFVKNDSIKKKDGTVLNVAMKPFRLTI